MAHIKVTRRSMRPEEYIDLRYTWLKRRIYENQKEVSPVMIRNAHQTGDVDFTFYEESPYELKKGDLCYTPDGSIFFEAEAAADGFDRGRSLWLYLKTTSEIIVKINGKYAGGLDPNRVAVDITPFVGDGSLKIEMLGFNRSKPDDERNPETLALRGCRQVYEGMYLCNVNEEIQNLCYDLEIFTDIIHSDLFSEDYRAFVIREVDAALNFIDFDDFNPEGVKVALSHIENKIYADKTYKGSGKVALVAHSHLDLAYYWRRIHTVQKNLRTVLIQMRLMDKYPEFTYCHTQAYTYETLKKYYPEVFEELKEKIKAGRFEPVGAMYVEPDCNIPNAESLIRQCLYGQKFYEENFGFTVDTCWLPDVFGNSWILPQILKKSGVKYFISNKMSTWNDTNRFPHNNFIWRGIDGTDIYASVPPTHFITWNEPSQVLENWEAFQDKGTRTETLNMFGYGDGGSGATQEMIELMRRFRKLSVMPETRHVTAKRFLEDNFTKDRDFDVWDGELYLEMHRGTFTTKANLKKYNRELEEKFRTAELISLFGKNRGDYPAEKIRELYKLFLIQQFHDILPGSHITPVYRDAVADLEYIDRELDAIIGTGARRLNTTNFIRNGVEFIEAAAGEFVRKGKKGRFAFVKAGPLGFAEVSDASLEENWIRIEGNKVSTDFYDEIVFSPDGTILSMKDSMGGFDWVKGDFNRLKLYDDKPGNYDAWDILPNYEENERPLKLIEPLHLSVLTGEAAEFICVQGTDKSRITRKIRLFRLDDGIEVEVNADWHESHKLLKVDLNPDLLARDVVCDTSAGFIRRPMHKNTSWEKAHFECCTHKWFDIDEGGRGLAVINDGKYGVGITKKGVSLSLLRATERPDPQSDLGFHAFCYKIIPHWGDYDGENISRKAHFYNSPLLQTDGLKIPQFLKNLCPLLLQSAKLSENGEKLIVRLTEIDGWRGNIKLPKKAVLCDMLENPIEEVKRLEVKPFEILTLAFDL